MKKHLLFMLLCILLLGSCRPAVKTAILPLSGSHIESAVETALSQKSSLDLEEALESQMQSAITEWGEQISLLDICTGDIGNDGTADAAVIIEYPYTGEFGSYMQRTVFVILDTSSYIPYIHAEEEPDSALYQNSSLVGGSIEGGMGQDPYQSMDISGGKLIIKESYRFGGTESSFSLVNGELIWDSYWISGLDRGSGDYDISFYDFLNGTLQYQAVHNWNQEEELQTSSFDPVTIPFHCENITDITSHIDQEAGFQP